MTVEKIDELVESGDATVVRSGYLGKNNEVGFEVIESKFGRFVIEKINGKSKNILLEENY